MDGAFAEWKHVGRSSTLSLMLYNLYMLDVAKVVNIELLYILMTYTFLSIISIVEKFQSIINFIPIDEILHISTKYKVTNVFIKCTVFCNYFKAP